MRDIRFRLYLNEWGEAGGKMFYDVMPTSPDYAEWLIALNGAEKGFDGDFKVGEHIADPMQFTGLKDSEGSDIFDGDLISLDGWSPKVYFVKWIKDGFYLAWASKTDNETFPFGAYVAQIHYAERGKVIGNIFENPELVK